MRAAAALAPASRANWVQAMQAEFETLDGGGAALGWAIGCVATASGWRLHAEAFYLAALSVAIIGSDWVSRIWLQAVAPFSSGEFLFWVHTISIVCLAGPCFALSLYRPDRVAVTLPAMVLFSGNTVPGLLLVLPKVLASPFDSANFHPALPGVVFALAVLWHWAWPALAGTGAGWVLGKAVRRWRIRPA
jgi:hypothetical protein